MGAGAQLYLSLVQNLLCASYPRLDERYSSCTCSITQCGSLEKQWQLPEPSCGDDRLLFMQSKSLKREKMSHHSDVMRLLCSVKTIRCLCRCRLCSASELKKEKNWLNTSDWTGMNRGESIMVCVRVCVSTNSLMAFPFICCSHVFI